MPYGFKAVPESGGSSLHHVQLFSRLPFLEAVLERIRAGHHGKVGKPTHREKADEWGKDFHPSRWMRSEDSMSGRLSLRSEK